MSANNSNNSNPIHPNHVNPSPSVYSYGMNVSNPLNAGFALSLSGNPAMLAQLNLLAKNLSTDALNAASIITNNNPYNNTNNNLSNSGNKHELISEESAAEKRIKFTADKPSSSSSATPAADRNGAEVLRKRQHQKSDKQRRARIKDGLEQLRSLVSAHGKLESPDQASIVAASVQLLQQLTAEINQLKQQINQAKNEHNQIVHINNPNNNNLNNNLNNNSSTSNNSSRSDLLTLLHQTSLAQLNSISSPTNS
jgi:hypothetical protein